MPKFGPLGLKLLKMLHLLMIVLFLGGILSSFALMMKLDLSKFDEVYLTYKNFSVISNHVVQIGAQGTILLGAIYGFFTRWGFIKHKWLVVKWILFIIQTFVGILIVDKLMVANIALLETEKVLALSDPVFLHNHFLWLYVAIAQIGLTLFALILSVLKPGRSRSFPEAKPITA
ncbi:MAG TPA: hypothetical protein VFR47_17875 [Anaerolineales bacterium]|nr:hypothetical protein [Anaerolineales bacterium]